MSQIIRDITEITRCGIQYRSEKLAPMGLKSCHASYLTEICAHPGLSQEQLATRICINKSNVARQAAILEEDGFLLRTPSPDDKRVMGLYPREKTLALLPQISKILQGWEQQVTQSLSPREKEALATLLTRVKANAVDWMEAD